MRRRLSLFLVMMLALSLPATAADPSADLEKVRKEIAALESQIDNSKAASRQVGEQLAAAQERLEESLAVVLEAQAKVDAKQSEIDTAQSRVDELTAHLQQIESQLASTRARLAATEEDLQSQAIQMYMSASTASGSAVMFSIVDAGDVALGLAYVDRVAGINEDLLDAYEILKADEERQKEDVESGRAEVERELVELDQQRQVLLADLADVESKQAQAEKEFVEVESLLSSIRSDIAAYEEHKGNLEEDAERLKKELAARQSKGGTRPGVLSWPVDGWVSSLFGYRIHPIFGTKKLHTGIDIAASSGSTIRATASGTVLIAGPYGGYGNAVVIDHGGGLATLYAHQSALSVSVGEFVESGQKVGAVGCTGYCTGPHLHFETRENGTPVDPMKYLG